MRCQIFARLTAVVIMQGSVATAGTPLWLDPVTMHANGMPLASTQSARDADLYHGCAREHLGACDGHYNMPVMNSLLRPNRCPFGPLPVLDTRTPGAMPTAAVSPPVMDGMDSVWMERLGPAPNVNPLQGGLGGPGLQGGVGAPQGLLSR